LALALLSSLSGQPATDRAKGPGASDFVHLSRGHFA
jgi:hypothetical protein